MYTGGFLIFILIMAVCEQLGMEADTIGILFVAFTVVIYAAIGWLSRTSRSTRTMLPVVRCPPFSWYGYCRRLMSGASFVAMAGGIYFGGHGYLAFVVGWTGGYVLVASLMAPYLRKFGCYNGAGFHRYALWRQPRPFLRSGGAGSRVVHLCDRADQRHRNHRLPCASDSIRGRGLVRTAGILLCSMLGGMRAVTWTQVAQYIVLIIAYLVPVFLDVQQTGFRRDSATGLWRRSDENHRTRSVAWHGHSGSGFRRESRSEGVERSFCSRWRQLGSSSLWYCA